MRSNRITHVFVEFIPKNLEEGVLYISKRFHTSSHLCCCGCGRTVITPLNPAKWSLHEHGETVSLLPSIGNGAFPCRSHYLIIQNQVRWCRPMTDHQTTRACRLDTYAAKVYVGEIQPPHLKPERDTPKPQGNWLEKWFRWLRS